MTSPTIFAIFMLCSPDLLTCEEHPIYQPERLTTSDECLDFIDKTVKQYKGKYILFGKCVWRIVKER